MVRIIELLTDPDRGPLTLAEIVRHIGLSRATAHAIVVELVEQGWVLRDPVTGAYGIGPGFVALARTADGADHLNRWAAASARELSKRFGIACFVARRTSPNEVTVADHAIPESFVDDGGTSPWFRHGRRIRLRPPICREFIAHEPAAVRSAWIGQAPEAIRTRLSTVLTVVAERGYSIERMTDDHMAMIEALGSLDAMSDRLRTRVGDLLTELSDIDYLPSELEGEVAAVTIGAPVFDEAGHVVASLVACPNATLPVEHLHRLAEATKSAANRLSAYLR